MAVMNKEMSMKTENQKFAESFGAVQSADGTFTLSADALNHLIESARNWGRGDDFDDNQICGGMRL
jgi:hypothetical protein